MEDKIKKWGEQLNVEPTKDLWDKIVHNLPKKKKKTSFLKKIFTMPYLVAVAMISLAICLLLLSGYLFFLKHNTDNSGKTNGKDSKIDSLYKESKSSSKTVDLKK